MFKYFKSKFKKQNQRQNYAWIVRHARATDVVYFGPFYSWQEVDSFFQDKAMDNGVQGNLELLISPNSPPSKWWYNPYQNVVQECPQLYDESKISINQLNIN